VLGQPGGWAVLVRYGTLERAVAAQRGRTPRLWRTLPAAAAFVKDELGLARFEVDAANYTPDPSRRRPDQAERLRQAHQAAEHDAWFRGEVQKTLDGIAAGTVGFISNDEHQSRWKRKRAELQARAAHEL
jgi:hypothetical protein